MNKKYFSMISEFPNNVIRSQTIEYISKLKKDYGLEFSLIIVISFTVLLNRRKELKKILEDYKNIYDINATIIPVWRNHFILSSFIGLFFLTLNFFKYRKQKIVIHARGGFTSNICAKLKFFYPNLSYVCDFRGDYEAENKFNLIKTQASKLKIRITDYLFPRFLKRALINANSIICVSNKLKNLIVEKYKCDPQKINVIPCLADDNIFYYSEEIRQKIRNEKNLNDKFVFVYAGGIGSWHYSDTVFKIVSEINRKFNNIFFIALTPNVKEAEEYSRKYSFNGNILIKSAAQKEVFEFLNAADMGLLLREYDPLNIVASPTKFAEYYLTGLPVMISDNIGDYSELVAKEKIGILLSNSPTYDEYMSEFQRFFEQYKNYQRNANAQKAKKFLSKNAYMKKLYDIYSSI